MTGCGGLPLRVVVLSISPACERWACVGRVLLYSKGVTTGNFPSERKRSEGKLPEPEKLEQVTCVDHTSGVVNNCYSFLKLGCHHRTLGVRWCFCLKV